MSVLQTCKFVNFGTTFQKLFFVRKERLIDVLFHREDKKRKIKKFNLVPGISKIDKGATFPL